MMQTKMMMNFSEAQLISAGEIVLYLSLAINVTLTTIAMLGLPSRSAFDTWWTTFGFCVVDDANFFLPTGILCYLSLTASAIVAYFLSSTKRFGDDDDKEKRSLKEINPMLGEFMSSVTFGHAAHGFGHIFIWFMGDVTPPIELSLDPAALANIAMLMLFWVGTLRNVVGLSINHATSMSVAVLIAQYLLRVPPELSFAYSQSVILFSSSLNQLRRRKDYLDGNNGFLFLAYSLYQLPLYVLFYTEMFSCSTSFLSKVGGHAVYDLYLALAPFVLCYAVIGEGEKVKMWKAMKEE